MKKIMTAAALLLSTPALAETIVAIRESDQRLISFDSATPGTLTGSLALTGIPGGAFPVALDFRADGTLFVLVTGPTLTTDCRLYTVNTTTGAATAVGGATATCSGSGDLDIDPVGGDVRLLKGSTNLRINTGTSAVTTDTAAAFAAADTNTGDTPDLIGSAYTGNISSPTTTTLFAIDADNDVLVRVGGAASAAPSPNGGELTTIGALGFDASFDAPFDISGATGTAYLFRYVSPAAPGQLYTVNTTTGAATLVGNVGTSSMNLLGMTVVSGVTLPGGGAAASGSSGGATGAGLLLALGLLGLGRRLTRRAAHG